MNSRPIILLFFLCVLTAAGAASPLLPAEFWGSVTIDGHPAPAGTVIVAKIAWNERGQITVSETGLYGSAGIYSSRLLVQATEDDLLVSSSPQVTFWVNGHKANQETPFVSGIPRQLDLTFTTGTGGSGETPIASGESSFDAGGIQTGDTGGAQQVTVNLQNPNIDVTTGANSIVMRDVGSGWDEITIETTGTPVTGANSVTGTVAGVTARTSGVTAEIDNSVGTATAQINVNMSRLPSSDASLTTTISREPDPAAQSAFLLTAQQSGRGISDVAYVINVQKTNVANAADGGVIQSATIRMTGGPAWVAAMGGIGNVVIMRRAEDGTTSALVTSYIGTDAAGNYIFDAVSPNGLSAFALLATSTGSGSGGSSSSGGGTGSSSSSTEKSSFVFDPDATPTAEVTPVSTPTSAGETPVQTAGTPAAAADAKAAGSDQSELTVTLSLTQIGALLVLGVLFAIGAFVFLRRR